MRKIISIEFIERTKSYTRTHAILDDGSIVIGFGEKFKVGDSVMSFYDHRWDMHKMELPKPLKEQTT